MTLKAATHRRPTGPACRLPRVAGRLGSRAKPHDPALPGYQALRHPDLLALAGKKIGPLFPGADDEGRTVGMRGLTQRPGRSRDWVALRARRTARRRAMAATRAGSR